MAAVTFTDHEGFQKAVLGAFAGSAAAGLLAYGLEAMGMGVPQGLLLTPLTCAAAVAGACGTRWRGRLGYGALGAVCGALPLLFSHHALFGLAVAGAGVGALFAHARGRRTDGATEVGQPRMGTASWAAALVLSAVALIAGRAVAEAFASRGLFEALLPAPLAATARTALIGFFLSLGGAGAHLVRDPDPVEKLYEGLLPGLSGDLKVFGARAMTNYRRCAEILATGEAGFARAQLSRSLSEVTRRILELARRWQAIDRELGERAEGELQQRLAELRTLKETSRDEIARRQLGVAEGSLQAELQQVDRIRRGRERVIARLHGEMALLDRTRVALLGLKTSDAHLRAAELSSISENLSIVAREMDCEAEAVDEIISKGIEARSPPSPSDSQPVTTVEGSASERIKN